MMKRRTVNWGELQFPLVKERERVRRSRRNLRTIARAFEHMCRSRRRSRRRKSRLLSKNKRRRASRRRSESQNLHALAGAILIVTIRRATGVVIVIFTSRLAPRRSTTGSKADRSKSATTTRDKTYPSLGLTSRDFMDL